MKKITLLVLLLLVTTFLFSNNIIKGRIIKVTDGDTVTLLSKNNKQIKIRLYGIDCPEKGQDYYQVAKNFVDNAIYDKNVEVEIINKDRYQRSVGIIWTSDHSNLNLELIKQGLAWHYKQFDKSKSYADAEIKARSLNKNIWSLNNATPPWEFRKNKKKNNKKQ